MRALTLLAGRDAYALLRDRGLRAEDVDIIPAASGGAKWLILAGLDRYLFGEFLQEPRERPMHLIGSSIGSWRMACLAQRDPVAALGRGHQAYIYEQRYTPKPSTAEVSAVLGRALDLMLGPTGVEEILSHPWARLHVITGEGRGLAAGGQRSLLMAGMGLVARGVAKSLGGRQLLRGLDLTITPGTRVGLLGPNGSGKSTLLGLLAGSIPPDAGAVEGADGLRIVRFEQHRGELEAAQPLRRALSPEGDAIPAANAATKIQEAPAGAGSMPRGQPSPTRD